MMVLATRRHELIGRSRAIFLILWPREATSAVIEQGENE